MQPQIRAMPMQPLALSLEASNLHGECQAASCSRDVGTGCCSKRSQDNRSPRGGGPQRIATMELP